ncbi:MAG: single-stranded DNA-binding protein [Leptospiraceae bacterium]|nr:single-stranded DNA-binding protein [Leptospiraceae bacterium]
MANDINNVILIGRITRDPEFKTVGQTSLANFSLANNRSYMDNGTRKDVVNYFDCVVWGKLAEVLKQYAGKGKQLMVEGRLEQSTWDGQDGKKQSKIRIRVENFQLLGGRPNSESQSSPEAAHSSLPSQTHFTPDIDEIPAEDIF